MANQFKSLFELNQSTPMQTTFVGDSPTYSLLSEDLNDGGSVFQSGSGGVSEISAAENTAQSWGRQANSATSNGLYGQVMGGSFADGPVEGWKGNPDLADGLKTNWMDTQSTYKGDTLRVPQGRGAWELESVNFQGIAGAPIITPRFEYNPMTGPGSGGGTTNAPVNTPSAYNAQAASMTGMNIDGTPNVTPQYTAQLQSIFGAELGTKISQNPGGYDYQGRIKSEQAPQAGGATGNSPTQPTLGLDPARKMRGGANNSPAGTQEQREAVYDRQKSQGRPVGISYQAQPGGVVHRRIDARSKESIYN